jgi:hypothetical protein
MAFCPHCQIDYDDDNETQPMCSCWHPLMCECNSKPSLASADVEDLFGPTARRRRASEDERP